MEFFSRLKAFIPTVFASETAINDVIEAGAHNKIQNEAHEVDPSLKEVTTKPIQKREINLSDGPDIYSDVLIERENSYEYFPERKERYQPSFWKTLAMMEGREASQRIRCERKLLDIVTGEPLIQLLIGALKTAGCNVDLRRNFSCELCYSGVCGGYDTQTQQIVMCMNTIRSKNIMTTVLAHELIHMFDHCVNDTDFKSAEHLACTEIRAINLTSCSLFDSFVAGYVSLTDMVYKTYHKKHALCVKDRALNSVMAASTSLSREEALNIIEKVFPHCYNDLEPIGRRLRHRTHDGDRAFYDGQHYGYV